MRLLLNKIPSLFVSTKTPIIPLCSRYNFTRHKSAYEGDGKSTMNILNLEVDHGLMIDSISIAGFRLNNGTTVLGPLVLFHRSILSWNVSHARNITAASLSLFKVLEPKMDFVVMGLGDPDDTKEHSVKVMKLIRDAKLNADIYNTEDACAVFNYLNSEGRNVAAILIPPIQLRMSGSDAVKRKMSEDGANPNYLVPS